MGKIMKKFELRRESVNVNEEWKWINGYEGLYEISTLGNVRNNFKQRIGTFKTKNGTMVKLKKDGFSQDFMVALLIFEAFYKRPGDYISAVHIIREDGSCCSSRLF